MASPNLATECTALVSFPVDDEASYATEAIVFDDDTSIAVQSTPVKHRMFGLKYEKQTNSQKASFEAFFDARLGQYGTFYWNHPRTSEVDILVRFVESKVKYTADSPTTWSWTVSLRKVV